MSGFVLTDHQLVTALAIGAIAPAQGSPLRRLPTFDRSIGAGEPEFDAMVERGLVRAGAGAWQLSSTLDSLLRAAANPNVVVDLVPRRVRVPRLTMVSRNELFECTLSDAGTRIYYPLASSTALDRVTGAFAAPAPAPAASTLPIVGDEAEVFALASALRRFRASTSPCRPSALRDHVVSEAADPSLSDPFEVVLGAGTVQRLSTDTERVGEAIKALVAAGHLVVRQGIIGPSPMIEPLVGQPDPGALLAIGRTELDSSGPRRAALLATRWNHHAMTLRMHPTNNGHRAFAWTEVAEPELGRLFATHILCDDAGATNAEPESAIAPSPAPPQPLSAQRPPPPQPLPAQAPPQPPPQPMSAQRPPPPQPLPAQRPSQQPAPPPPVVHAAAPAPAPAPAPAWYPTHTVPASGTNAWSEPNAAAPPVSMLDPHLPIRVDAWQGEYAHVTCSNGWTCWVDGRVLHPGA